MERPEIRPLDLESSEEGSADLEKLLQTAESENLHLVKLIDTERQRHEAFQNQIEETIKQTEELEESTKCLDTKAKELHNKFKQNREICEGLKKTATVLDEHEEALRGKFSLVTLEQQSQTAENDKVIEKYEKMWERFLKKYQSIPLAKELSELKEKAITTEISVKETSEKITNMKSQIVEMEIDKTHMQEYLQGGHPETGNDFIVKIAKLSLEAENTAGTVRERLKELKQVQDDLRTARENQKNADAKRVEKTTEENEEKALEDGDRQKISDKVMEVVEQQTESGVQHDGHDTRAYTSGENHQAVTSTIPQTGSTIPATTTTTTRDDHIRHAANQLMNHAQLSSRHQESKASSGQSEEQPVGRGPQTQLRTLPLITTPLRGMSHSQKEPTAVQTSTQHHFIQTMTSPRTLTTYSSAQTAPQSQPENTQPINQFGPYGSGRFNQSTSTITTTSGQSESRIATTNQSQSRMTISQSGQHTPSRVNQPGQNIATTNDQSGPLLPTSQSASRSAAINQSEAQTASSGATSHVVSQSEPSIGASGSHTPVHHQSGSGQSQSGGTPVQGSPLDFSKHMRFIQSVSKSPGEGFTYQGRAMYSNQVFEADEQQIEEENEPEVIYEAPLNDQHDISLTFFQPFSQQSQQESLQENANPTPETNRNIFAQSSPAKSDTNSDPGFSFGPGAASPNVSTSGFLATNSAGSIFGGTMTNDHQTQSNEPFAAGFSFFGGRGDSSQSPQTTDSGGGFSFSFGGGGGEQSPARPNKNGGFSLF